MIEFCEQSVGVALLQLVSRAQALIAELLRLSDRVPEEFLGDGSIYRALLFDFSYFKSIDVFEERIESDTELSTHDDDFREKFSHLLERFFNLFNGIVNYYLDLKSYIDDLQEGVYIQNTVESVLHDEDGCQLLVEALSLHGITLLLLEHRLGGALREHLLVAHFRCRGTIDVPNFELICTLCRRCPRAASASVLTLLQGAPLPVPASMINLHKPEEFLSRFPLPASLVQAVVGRLRTHDLYSQVRHYPSQDHKTTALLGQAASLHVLLYFAPEILHSDAPTMREIVNKFFRVYWVIPVFMGFTVDLLSAWSQLKAAKAALVSCITPAAVRGVVGDHKSKVSNYLIELGGFLSDGVLNENYVLTNMPTLLSCARNCNATLRWILLHQTTSNRKFREIVTSADEKLLTLLLDTSRLEFELKSVYNELLSKKEARWMQSKALAAECMQDLAEHFSGAKVFSKAVKDESLQQWFTQIANQINALDYGVAVTAGRKIQHLITALEEVEQFHQIEGSLQTKQYLLEARNQLQEMLRTLNVQESVLATLSVVSDSSYAWGLIGEYTNQIHSHIQKDPFTVSKLQCLFLKLRSVMDIPLIRICQCQSADLESVSEYYSSELVAYVRKVLEIVPVSMFAILNGIIKEQTKLLRELPGRIEKDSLREYAKLNERYTLAKATQRIAVFTQGIMSMRRTFIGAIELDPRQLLEDGIRKQLAEEIHLALDNTLVFTGQAEELENKLDELQTILHTQRQSMEYFQDYVHVHGLRLWQEEFTKIINHYEESTQYTIKKPGAPKQQPHPSKTTCIGRVVSKLLSLTNPSKTMYLAPMSGWFIAEGQEVVGLRTFTVLQESLGPAGSAAIDSLICFDIAVTLQRCISTLSSEVDDKLVNQLQQLEASVDPVAFDPQTSTSSVNSFVEAFSTSTLCISLVDHLAHIGQLQLIRCLLSSQLLAASELNSGLISFALKGLNISVLAEHHKLDEMNKKETLGELTQQQLQSCGMCSPMKTVYVSSKEPDHLSLVLFLITITQLTRFVYDQHLGTLVSRSRKSSLDFHPLVTGVHTLLRQFHASYTDLYIQLLRSYAQTHVQSLETPSKTTTQLDVRITNIIKWILEFGSDRRLQPSFLECFS